MGFSIASLDIQTALFCLAAFLIVSWWLRRPKHLPPGPWGWPLVGYLPNLVISIYRTGMTNHEFLAKLARKYGSVFSMNLGGNLVVVLDKHDAVKEAFNNPDISDRPKVALWEEMGLGDGLVQASGEPWKHQRRFTLTTLRSFGVGKRNFEENIAEEVKHLSQEISLLEGTSFDPQCYLSNATANVICCVVFGQRFEYTDSTFRSLLHSLDEVLKLSGSGGLQAFFPLAKYFQPTIYTCLKQNIKNVKGFVDKAIEEHQQEFNAENDPNDYIDVYLKEIQMAKKMNVKSFIDLHNLAAVIVDLFGAGTDTTSTTLRWATLYMMAYPVIQERVQKELDSVIGRNRLPRLADKTELPFTCATLLEIQRIGSIAPLGVIHYSSNDTTLAGYNIPKGSVVISNLWGVHHDPETWPNPDQFHPERFLDEYGDVMDREELTPFSIGRRVCIGEHLAKMELFIFFTHLLHQFTFKKPDDSSPLSFEGINSSVIYSPQPFMTHATRRE
ncbi:cytochrome P450 2J4-like [Amphiura filiformis]|uniref:cytochrome P450 2J4-like n=1 Tax=Amphiura filiformis TaxID=82378 RepID=UPI003B2272A7